MTRRDLHRRERKDLHDRVEQRERIMKPLRDAEWERIMRDHPDLVEENEDAAWMAVEISAAIRSAK